MGKIVKSLMDEGATLGVSSRGMGSLDQRMVRTMFVKTSCSQPIDIVAIHLSSAFLWKE